MGRTSVCERSVWSLQNNPAGMAFLNSWHLGLYYENQWLLRETAFKAGAAIKSVPNVGCFGVSVQQFGGGQYSESRLGLAYARGFGPYLQLGLSADYLLLHWGEGYPNRGAFSISLGMQSQLTERLRAGACIFHPIPVKTATLNGDQLPVVMRFGLAFQCVDDFVVQVDVEKDRLRSGVRLSGGFEYLLLKQFSLRAGIQHNPDILSFGAAYSMRHLKVDVAAQMHQMLGASVQIGINYEFERQ